MTTQIRSPFELLNNLKLSLAIREPNDKFDKSLRGNPGELFFLLSSKVVPIYKENVVVCFEQMSNKYVHFITNGSVKLKQTRAALSEFLKSSDKNISFDDLTNVDFLNNLENKTTDILQLIDAVKVGEELRDALDNMPMEEYHDKKYNKIFTRPKADEYNQFMKNDYTNMLNKLQTNSYYVNLLVLRCKIGMLRMLKYELIQRDSKSVIHQFDQLIYNLEKEFNGG